MKTIGSNGAMECFRHAAGLAAAISRPFSAFDQTSLHLGPLSAGETSRLAVHGSFRRPLEGAILAERKVAATDIAAETLQPELAGADRSLAVAFLSEPVGRLRETGLLLGAAALHRHMLHLTHKADRTRIRHVVGEPVHRVAIQVAPTLHPGIAMADARRVLDLAMDEARSIEAAREVVINFGLALVARFVALTAPDLHGFMLHRLPDGARAPEIVQLAEAMETQQARHVTRFLRRRVPEWSAITG